MHCVHFIEKFWPPKHIRIPGFSLMAACLGYVFSLCNMLLYRQGKARERQGASKWCLGGRWMKAVNKVRAYSTGKPERCWAGLGRNIPHHHHPLRPLNNRKEILSGAQGQAVLATIQKDVPILGEMNSLEGQRGRVNTFLNPLFIFFVSSNPFEFSLS